MTPPIHRYSARCSWRGSTGLGYDAYLRDHDGSAPPAEAALALSSDPAFGGSPERLNPEQLVVLAASSCQLLAFLAAAARARIDVLAYDDEAESAMSEDDPPARISRIVLRPRIVVAAGTSEQRVRGLVDTAHRECYVANSLRTAIKVLPSIAFR